ncbi:MAG: peptidase M23, partial [Candidatus Thiodiazotropha sp. 6PLUC4]
MLRLSCLLALCLSFCGSLFVQQASADESEKDAKSKLEQVKRRIQNLQNQLRSTEGKREEQNRALQDMEMQIGALARRIRVTKQSLKRQQRRLAELEGERADARLHLDQHRSSLERQLRAAYAMGRQEKMKILLNQQDPAVVSRVMVYYDYFNTARIEQMVQIRKNLQQLKAIEHKIAQEEQRLQQLQTKNLNQKRQFEAAQVGRKEIIASLNSRLQNKGQELQSLKSDEKQL